MRAWERLDVCYFRWNRKSRSRLFLLFVLRSFFFSCRDAAPYTDEATAARLDTTRKRIARGIKIRDAGALNHLHTELPRLRGRTTLAIVQFYNRVMPRSERANEQAGKQCDRQTRRTATRRVIARKISQGTRCRVIANFCERLRAVPLESRRKKEKDRTARKTRDMSSVHNPILYLRLL